jgi:hypothetical protein
VDIKEDGTDELPRIPPIGIGRCGRTQKGQDCLQLADKAIGFGQGTICPNFIVSSYRYQMQLAGAAWNGKQPGSQSFLYETGNPVTATYLVFAIQPIFQNVIVQYTSFRIEIVSLKFFQHFGLLFKDKSLLLRTICC